MWTLVDATSTTAFSPHIADTSLAPIAGRNVAFMKESAMRCPTRRDAPHSRDSAIRNSTAIAIHTHVYIYKRSLVWYRKGHFSLWPVNAVCCSSSLSLIPDRAASQTSPCLLAVRYTRVTTRNLRNDLVRSRHPKIDLRHKLCDPLRLFVFAKIDVKRRPVKPYVVSGVRTCNRIQNRVDICCSEVARIRRTVVSTPLWRMMWFRNSVILRYFRYGVVFPVWRSERRSHPREIPQLKPHNQAISSVRILVAVFRDVQQYASQRFHVDYDSERCGMVTPW